MGGELTCQSLEKGTADSTLKSSTGGLRIGVGAVFYLSTCHFSYTVTDWKDGL
jgi:hypothetical protein